MERDDWKEFSEILGYVWTAWEPWFSEAKEDLKFYLGDQWKQSDKDYLDSQGRPALVINKNIRRFVHLLVGYERQNRMDIDFKPIEGSDAQTCEDFTELMKWALDHGGHTAVSTCFGQSIKVGLDWINPYMDYEDDMFSGDVRFKRVPWTKIMVDPLFQELDLSDANYLIRREILTQKQLEMLMPGKNIEDSFRKTNQVSMGPFMDPGLMLPKNDDRYMLSELWERDYKAQNYVIDTQSGQMRPFELNGQKSREKLQFILATFPQLRTFKRRVKTVNLSIFVGEDRIYRGEDPNGCGEIPYVPMMAYFDPEYEEMKWKLQGIIRALRDPQTELNKRRSQLLHIINTIARSGWKWEEGAVGDESVFNNASGAGVLIRTKEGKLGMVEQIQGPNFPSDIVRIEEMFAQDGVDISGINAELLAMMDKDMPGISIQLRQRQGLVILQDLFDNKRVANKKLGSLYQKMVAANYKPDKVMRLLGRPPAPAFYTRDFGKYDAIPDESVNSPTQKDANFQKMMYIHQNVTPVHPFILLELADIPERYRDMQIQFMMGQMAQAQAAMMAGAGGPPPGGQGTPGSPSPAPKQLQAGGG